MEGEPWNVQVVVKDCKKIFLIDNEGVIVSAEHVSNECMSQVHVGDISEHMRDDEIDHMGYIVTNNELLVTVNEVENLHGALHDVHFKNEQLKSMLYEHSALLHRVTEQLEVISWTMNVYNRNSQIYRQN